MSRSIKMVYDENFRFRSWLNKLKDKQKIFKESKKFMTKPRKGNTFMVLGANGYCGWATVVQLAFQYSGCNIICCDKNIDSRPNSITEHYPLHQRLRELHNHFSFNSVIIHEDMEVREVLKNAVERYKPQFIIDLADGFSELFNPVMMSVLHVLNQLEDRKTHLILSTSYGSITNFSQFKTFPITELKTGKVFAPFIMPSLISPKLAPYNNKESFLNKLIVRLIERPEIKYKEQTFISSSLETFTRAICEVIRTGTTDRDKNYKYYKVAEQDISQSLILHILRMTMRRLDKIDLKYTKIENKRCNYMFDKNKMFGLMKEFEPPLHTFISYSYKYIKDNLAKK